MDQDCAKAHKCIVILDIPISEQVIIVRLSCPIFWSIRVT